jgi:CubicO group peptidase (beta-lactamase class C family)
MLPASRLCRVAVAAVAFVFIASNACAEGPVVASPGEAGFSAAGLARIDAYIKNEIDQNKIPGAILMIQRNGKTAYFNSFGVRDPGTKEPMTPSTIFRIYSMSKPITTVAAMMLVEEGKLQLDDPLSKYIPAFADVKVGVERNGENGAPELELVPVKRPITIQDLMRHTSGIVYGGRGSTAVHKLYPTSSSSAATTLSGAEFLDKLGSLPLLYQPGTVWDYGFGLDVLGLVVEQIEEQTLGQYLDEHLFKPLGMVDTTFRIPPEKAARYAKALPNDPDTGKPQSVPPLLTEPLKFECGGGCAASTASDYLRFALMLLDKGKFGQTRILGRKTVEYMLSDQLGPNIKNLIGNADPTRAGYGFGLGLAVRTTPGIARTLGSVGDFSWPGASGTNWWADPREDLAVVFMAHSPGPIRWHYRQVINAMVERAIVD